MGCCMAGGEVGSTEITPMGRQTDGRTDTMSISFVLLKVYVYMRSVIIFAINMFKDL